MTRTYTLIGVDGRPYPSAVPGTLGGHRRNKGYGRLDCPAALMWIERGHYVRHRVFFADEATAIAAGYRPCARCLPRRYAQWKAARAGRGEWPPRDAAFRLELPARRPFAAERLLAYFGARAIAGVEAVNGRALRRTLALPHGPGSVALRVGASGARGELRLANPCDRDAAVAACRRLLDVHADPRAIAAGLGGDAVLGPLLAAAPGQRAPGAAGAFEVLVRAIVGQQVSLAGARRLLGRIAAELGQTADLGHAGATRVLPSATHLAAADPAALPLPAARSRALVRAAELVASGELVLDPDGDCEEAHDRLLEIPGIGAWTAGYVRMRGLGDPDVVLEGDLGIRRAFAALGLPSGPAAIRSTAERWRPWRTYAMHLLWSSAAG